MCLSLSLCLQGAWSSSDFHPVVCERRGDENPASWLDDMLGDTLLNCFDRCAVRVTIKKLALLKYTSGSQAVKYRCSVQYVCWVGTLWFVCVWMLFCVTLLGNVWHVLCFVYQAWNEPVSSLILFKYLSPSRCTSEPAGCSYIFYLSKVDRVVFAIQGSNYDLCVFINVWSEYCPYHLLIFSEA